jgi:hypothetical protein
VHTAQRVALGHLLVQDAAAGGHPLHVAGRHFALVAQAVAMHLAGFPWHPENDRHFGDFLIQAHILFR